VTKEENFPVEKARLRLMPLWVAIFAATCAGYGWTLQAHASIAAPLILQIIVGWASVAVMNITTTLLIDLVPNQSSSITACNNLVRCSFGAALVSVMDLILTALGTGWTYVLLAGICVACTPILAVTMYMGPKWRARRRQRTAR